MCYRLTLKKERAEKWLFGQGRTLKGFPFRDGLPLSSRTFESFKRKVVRHYQERLDRLKYRGEKLRGDVDGLDLEYELNHLARLAGSKTRGLFHGYASWLEDTFRPRQRRELLDLIDRIERDVAHDVNLASLLLHRE